LKNLNFIFCFSSESLRLERKTKNFICFIFLSNRFYLKNREFYKKNKNKNQKHFLSFILFNYVKENPSLNRQKKKKKEIFIEKIRNIGINFKRKIFI
jgi:hypothetical protein